MNRVAAFALRRKNSILSMSEKMFCPPQPLRFWITPACAGKRCRSPAFRSMPWDHPRMCGEKSGHNGLQLGILGITPACAGKSCPPQAPTFTRQDHPRVCGEKPSLSVLGFWAVGSPPRVRGKVGPVIQLRAGPGITPARAGKSQTVWSGITGKRDHPRVCREKAGVGKKEGQEAGSPPRMRGKVPSSI